MPEKTQQAANATNSLVQAMVYLTVSAFPGWTKERLNDYWVSQNLFKTMLEAMAPKVGLVFERLCVEAQGEKVSLFAVFPQGSQKVPTVLMTNGLEGTIQELLLPSLKYRISGFGVIAMEMPGTYAYLRPMSETSEGIYNKVIEAVCAHPRVDAKKLAMFGASFGAYWSTRMAAKNKRITSVISNGGPYHHSFSPKATLGIPEIILSTMVNTTGALNNIDLGKKLHELDISHLYAEITQPCLVINGEKDTLISTQDSIDLAQGSGGSLVLYPDDDHCAMGHYSEWSELVQQWLLTNFEIIREEPAVRAVMP
jgi:esterase FrsA